MAKSPVAKYDSNGRIVSYDGISNITYDAEGNAYVNYPEESGDVNDGGWSSGGSPARSVPIPADVARSSTSTLATTGNRRREDLYGWDPNTESYVFSAGAPVSAKVFTKEDGTRYLGYADGSPLSEADTARINNGQQIDDYTYGSNLAFDPLEQIFADLTKSFSGMGVSFGGGGGGAPPLPSMGEYDSLTDITSLLKNQSMQTLSKARFEGSEEGFDRREGLARANVESANKSAQQQAAARLGEIGMSPERIADMQAGLAFDSVKNTVGALGAARRDQEQLVMGLQQQGFGQLGQLGELRNAVQGTRNQYEVGMSNAAAAHSQAAASMANAQANMFKGKVDAASAYASYIDKGRGHDIDQQRANTDQYQAITGRITANHETGSDEVVMNGGGINHAPTMLAAGNLAYNMYSGMKPTGLGGSPGLPATSTSGAMPSTLVT